MTGTQFRKLHGDPAGWSDDEYEQFAECATPGDPEPARVVLARLREHLPTNLPTTTGPGFQPAA